MLTVIACVREDHDLRLVLLAALICVLASATALRFHRRQAKGEAPAPGLLALIGLIAGAGVWATHFVAMLAYQSSLAIEYDLGMTAASLAVAVLGMCGGFGLSVVGQGAAWRLTGGAGIGLSIAGMHFIGIAAMRSAFHIQWDWGFVAASVILSIVGACAALEAVRRTSGVAGWIVPPLCLVGGIVGLHFTAMAAITLAPDHLAPTVRELIDRGDLAILVGGIALLILAAAGGMAVMETRLRHAALRHLEAAFQGVPNGLAMFDAAGRLVVWNEAYAALLAPFGIRPAIGMSRRGLALQAAGAMNFKPENPGQWAVEVEAERKNPEAQEWPTPDGGWIRAQTAQLDSGGTISVVSDVSAEKAMHDLTEEARRRAEAASRAKSEFLTNMSHEIRTPLNGILGMVQVMAGDALSNAQRERLEIVRESGGALLAVLNDVLDLAKVQSGKLELHLTETDLAQICRRSAAGFEAAAAARDVGVTVEIDPAVEGLWLADGLRVRQILANLIGNAVKFTEEGGVRVTAGRTPTGVRLAVSDTGIGIAPAQLTAVFDKFSQADASNTRRYGGTGLGLAICRELAELMGGEIGVESELGRGSCFRVDLPLSPADGAGQPSAEAFEGPAPIAGGLRILAAEDNPTNQLVLRSLLGAIDCELVLVGDGAQAAAEAQAGVFDLILMDVQMPVMNGLDATRAIREHERATQAGRTPIIALTANVMTHQLDTYRAAGMDGCVAKPIRAEDLFRAIAAAAAGSTEAEAA